MPLSSRKETAADDDPYLAVPPPMQQIRFGQSG
jgi:hypothetical protein